MLSCFAEKVAASAADADSTKQQNHNDDKDTVSTPLATEDKTSKASSHPGITETEGQYYDSSSTLLLEHSP